MTSKTPSYNRMLVAERKKVALRAADAEEDAADAISFAAPNVRHEPMYQAVLDVVVEVTFDALDAWKQVARWRIGAWVDQRTGDRPSRTSGAGSSGQPNGRPGRQRGHSAPPGIPLNSHSLGSLVDLSQPHERTPVTMPSRSRGWLARGRPAGRPGRSAAPRPRRTPAVAGGWLVLVTLCATLALAIYSRGFRRGPSWAHLAAFGTGLLGLALHRDRPSQHLRPA